MSSARLPQFERHELFGVPVDVVTETHVLAASREAVEGNRPIQIVTVNAEFVMKAQSDAAFREVLQRAGIATADGAGVVWALRRRGIRVRRLGGSDLIWSLSELASRLGYPVYFLGAAEGVAEETAARLRARYPGLQVAGTLAGSPRPEDESEIVASVRASGARILFVAWGAPAQELWIARNLERLGVSVAIGVGGSFDYVAGRARRAPVWVRERGLDWLWRLVMQPWRWKRMLALPRFAFLVLTSPAATARRTRHDPE
jgi:N-acetylglucosaminyldiphosphoundecaprenol N-acetyl-beta-D-mannosaminyltransferase